MSDDCKCVPCQVFGPVMKQHAADMDEIIRSHLPKNLLHPDFTVQMLPEVFDFARYLRDYGCVPGRKYSCSFDIIIDDKGYTYMNMVIKEAR